MARLLHGFILALLLLGVAACGPKQTGVRDLKLVPVSGKVTIQDKPLTSGMVMYHPDEAKGGDPKLAAMGMIDPDGNYQLNTLANPGATLGWYKVVIVAREMPGKSSGSVRIHKKYSDPATTDLSVQVVKDAGAGQYDLKLSR